MDRQGDHPALRVTAQVKAERVTKAIVDVIFLDEDEKWIEHHWVSYIGAKKAKDPPTNHDWKEYAGRVAIPQTAKKIQVALQIYGPGKVWFDEVARSTRNSMKVQVVACESIKGAGNPSEMGSPHLFCPAPLVYVFRKSTNLP